MGLALLMEVLCLNGGSSSLKLATFDVEGAKETPGFAGSAERIGVEGGSVSLEAADGRAVAAHECELPDHAAALTALLDLLAGAADRPPDAVGHRLVHGGRAHAEPVRVRPDTRASFDEVVPLAPLHLPANLAVLDAMLDRAPDVPHVACFDTGFHTRMPERAKRFAIPGSWHDRGVRRYGFHGLSCEYAVDRLDPGDDDRTIVAHLGNGASLTAIVGRRSVWNTMGFTPAGGIMMGTRSGDLDPGLLVHLLRSGMDVDAVDRLINEQSGLAGVSGAGRDMRRLLELRETDSAAALAIELFCDQVRMAVGALTALLGGLDCLVFTGGIGERAAPVRAGICAGLEHLGIAVDDRANRAHAATISTAASPVRAAVVETDENRMIARHVGRLLAA